ncbi:meiotic nuclear division protein 1 homolog [Brevipalpus obovatus]|uniref:meiotic nuclear division protein 1 homolog n=1 Tax=Brevipalpus obovatus TaxID=246614 RepID=UPI003D9DF976
MSKKGGVSREEKLIRAKSYFIETRGVFQMKDLEKSLPKEKGIPFPTVKDVLKELVGCDEVDTDKIGSSTYYWSFPSKKSQSMKIKVEELRKKVGELEASVAEKRQLFDNMDEEGIKERLDKKCQIDRLKIERNVKKKNFDSLKANDPAFMGRMKMEIPNILEELNLWGGNIEAVRTYMRNQYGFEEERFNYNFDIPDDLDVPETINSYAKRFNII